MRRYGNRHGDSGVRAWAVVPDGIAVEFRGGGVYVYTHESAGAAAVTEMRALAEAGRGLSSYISRHVSEAYAAVHPDRRAWRAAVRS
ncbi:hypothetical protein [Coralloluteibacterium stylophorae]|uniref:Uncharacterized protein n=1 Tax=Coralloluteibacterium stylophorae TaxID=1776034 RepID=A0A8J7VS05_9GAMM|nr:hypothetical protein [Coralloluteibacterium stylophorae]MBS7455547.1 hypothetical protein [Coralloluteibacterium stylophorae]